MPDTTSLKEPLSLSRKFFNSIFLICAFTLLHRIPIVGVRWYGEAMSSRVGLFRSQGAESRTHLFQNVRACLWFGDILSHVLLKITQAVVVNIKGRKEEKVTRRIRNFCSILVLPVFAFSSVLSMYRDPFFTWAQLQSVPFRYSKPTVAAFVFGQLLAGSLLSVFINMHCHGRVLLDSAFPWSLWAEAAYALLKIVVDPALFTAKSNFDVRYAALYTLSSLILLFMIGDFRSSFSLRRTAGGLCEYPPTPLLHTDTMIFALIDQLKSSLLWLLKIFDDYASVRLIPQEYWLHFEPQPAVYALYCENPRWKQIVLVQIVTNVLGFIVGSYITVYVLKQGDGASMAQNFQRSRVYFDGYRNDPEVLLEGCEGIVGRAMRRTYLLGPAIYMLTNIFPLLGLNNTSFLVMTDYVGRLGQEIRSSPKAEKGLFSMLEPA
jgi:hypothetical protein